MDGKRIMEKEKEVDERKQDTNGEKSYSYIREKRIRPRSVRMVLLLLLFSLSTREE